ncbi:hypothetical protein L3Q82_008991 [Scortum barcoo]|uniref:Uncharacterized protein n=1 Tax=Scortum barcoo TaxID=214431 RepID=A0ACB8XCJ6_9TELE|nr:hypothetical protein L3Q82_008991 [Scortum barcoo]
MEKRSVSPIGRNAETLNMTRGADRLDTTRLPEMVYPDSQVQWVVPCTIVQRDGRTKGPVVAAGEVAAAAVAGEVAAEVFVMFFCGDGALCLHGAVLCPGRRLMEGKEGGEERRRRQEDREAAAVSLETLEESTMGSAAASRCLDLFVLLSLLPPSTCADRIIRAAPDQQRSTGTGKQHRARVRCPRGAMRLTLTAALLTLMKLYMRVQEKSGFISGRFLVPYVPQSADLSGLSLLSKSAWQSTSGPTSLSPPAVLHKFGIKLNKSSVRWCFAKTRGQIIQPPPLGRLKPPPLYGEMCSEEWNEKLALLATERAAQCEADPSPQHSSSFSHTGWNTHFSSYGVKSFSDIIDLWFEEGKDFLYLSGQCRENATCQHYTQLVWATSSHVGCASQLCLREGDLWELFVCAYYPGRAPGGQGLCPWDPAGLSPKWRRGPAFPVGSPPAGRSMRGQCNVVWVAVVAGGLDDPIPGPKLWPIGTWNVTSLGGKEPELVREVERYRLEIVGLHLHA